MLPLLAHRNLFVATESAITCSKLLLGQPYTSPYQTGDLPLCILTKVEVEVHISIMPPTAKVCFGVELTSRTYAIPDRCLNTADRGRVTLRVPADVSHHPEARYVVIRTSTFPGPTIDASAHSQLPPGITPEITITTTVSPLKESAQPPPTNFLPAASHPSFTRRDESFGRRGVLPAAWGGGVLPPPPPPCPASSVSGECLSEEQQAIKLCRPDSDALQSLSLEQPRLYANCRASDCSADVVRPVP